MKCLHVLCKFSQLVWRTVRRICILILGLKGLKKKSKNTTLLGEEGVGWEPKKKGSRKSAVGKERERKWDSQSRRKQ